MIVQPIAIQMAMLLLHFYDYFRNFWIWDHATQILTTRWLHKMAMCHPQFDPVLIQFQKLYLKLIYLDFSGSLHNLRFENLLYYIQFILFSCWHTLIIIILFCKFQSTDTLYFWHQVYQREAITSTRFFYR